MNLLIKFI